MPTDPEDTSSLSNTAINEKPSMEPLVSFTKTAMACSFEIFSTARGQKQLAQSIVPGFDLIDDLEQQMTVFAENSEVISINRLAATRPVTVEAELFGLLQTAMRIAEMSGGSFDITTSLLSRVWGFHRRGGQIPSEQEIRDALSRTGYQKIDLEPQEKTIYFRHPDLEIDLGGIGKGFALDRLCEQLEHDGNCDFVIHGGQSSVVARGDRSVGAEGDDPQGWLVGLSHPLKADERIATIRLVDCALGTSGSARQSFVHNGKRYGHVLDPRTGWPTDKLLSATVLAPTAAEADALATAIFVDGAELANQICSASSPYRAILVSEGKGSGEVDLQTVNIQDGVLQIARHS